MTPLSRLEHPFRLLLPLLLAAATAYGQRPGQLSQSTSALAGNSANPFKAQVKSISLDETLHIVVGASLMLTRDTPLRRIYVGNPQILQTLASGSNEVVVTAKQAGRSSLVIWDMNGKSCLYSISADVDPSGLRHSVDAAFPNNQVNVQGVESRIMLSGSVASPEIFDDIAKLASVYTKEVANSLQIIPAHVKQVELKLRIVEVDRTKLEQFGVNFFVGQGNNIGSTSTQQFNVTGTKTVVPSPGISTASVSDPLNFFLYNFSSNVGVTVKDLEQKDIVQVLAEPTLTTISGLPARFLSGGEFPFPVVQGGTGNSTAITIQFRQYGVKVDFTPTVNADGSIRLKVAPEVSTLDFSNAVTISGFTIPALSTRRAESEVELKSGQSFMLSGLLDHRTTENLSKVPGIASVPILGQLFRSRNNNHSVSELVVIVTATIVDPIINAEKIKEPAMVLPNLTDDTFDRLVMQTGEAKAFQPSDLRSAGK